MHSHNRCGISRTNYELYSVGKLCRELADELAMVVYQKVTALILNCP